MARVDVHQRIATVTGPGTLLVGSDLHGNLEDFRALVARFEADDDAVLFLLGDLFHGPSIEQQLWQEEFPFLGDWYPDQSLELLEELLELMEQHPTRVASLLGNHEHGHVGGPIVAKFHADESAAFEARLVPRHRRRLHDLIHGLPLLGLTPCGLVLIHGAPPRSDFDRKTLAQARLDGHAHLQPFRMLERGFLGEVLWRRGSNPGDTERFLERVTALDGPAPATVVVHGHEVAREGWDWENDHQLTLSTSFGMTRAAKTFLQVDLERPLASIADMRPGLELLPLWPEGG